MASLITTVETIINLIENDLPLFKSLYSSITLTAEEVEQLYASLKPTSATNNSNTNT